MVAAAVAVVEILRHTVRRDHMGRPGLDHIHRYSARSLIVVSVPDRALIRSLQQRQPRQQPSLTKFDRGAVSVLAPSGLRT